MSISNADEHLYFDVMDEVGGYDYLLSDSSINTSVDFTFDTHVLIESDTSAWPQDGGDVFYLLSGNRHLNLIGGSTNPVNEYDPNTNNGIAFGLERVDPDDAENLNAKPMVSVFRGAPGGGDTQLTEIVDDTLTDVQIVPGTWAHVTYSCDAESNTLYLYVNGTLTRKYNTSGLQFWDHRFYIQSGLAGPGYRGKSRLQDMRITSLTHTTNFLSPTTLPTIT